MAIKRILITVVCLLFCILVMSCYVLYNKNKRITDEERKLQSHADELNKYFGKKSYGIDNLNYTEIDPLAIVFSCDFDRVYY